MKATNDFGENAAGTSRLGSIGTSLPDRNALAGYALAIVEFGLAILVLGFGLLGLQGNNVVTAAYLVGSLAALAVFSLRGIVEFRAIDFAYAVYVAAIVFSFMVNPIDADRKEIYLLALTLLAYPAARSLTARSIPFIHQGFLIGGSIVSLLGTVCTAWALATQWDDAHGQPIVFGLTIAAPLFAQSVSFLAIAVSTERCSRKASLFWCMALFVPIAVFAASMVRFALIAMAAALVVSVLVAETGRRRWHAASILVTAVAAIGFGLAVHYKKTIILAEYAVEATPELASPSEPTGGHHRRSAAQVERTAPSCRLNVNAFNSIAIREALLKDSLYLIPRAGFFGLGLDGFMSESCVRDTPPHDTILQGYVEFGWIGGSALAVVFALAFIPIIHMARRGHNATFLICCLTFLAAMSIAHGRISREIGLFAFLGTAAGVADGRRALVS